uniref:DNA polymerase II small subunit n=1 Tax=Siphoviridae sp. ctuka10 TaxID=2825716 RepID=A0A8S5PA61_9CAUD|nr:MAG TPA: DNA polymerase II small subunit [Siphoviridae sp. ctuka10]
MSPLDEAIIANDALPERERKTNQDLADEFNTSEATVRRHRRALKRKGRDELARDAFFDLPVGAITKRGKTVRLADGSYEKIEYRPGALEMEEAKRLSYEDLEPVFREPLLPKPARLFDKGETLIVCMADFQVGKTGQGGGTEDTVRLVRRAISDIAHDVNHVGGYERIILADVGDSTEGFWNVASQAQTNDLSLTDQIRTVQRLYAGALQALAPLCSSLYYVAVPSNHCAVRVGPGKNSRANAPDDDFGIMVSKNIEDVIEDRPGFEHVEFFRPEKWEEAVTVDAADGTRIGFTHGHLAGSQSKVPGWFRDLAFGRRSGLYDARILVHGHWHNFSVSQAGDARWIISCPSADRGSDWWTNISGDSTRPAILTFEARDGNASSWELYS